MKNDIDFPKVEKVGICAIPETDEENVSWRVHIINLLDEELTNVLVSTRGYGKKDDDKVNTSELRYYFADLKAKSSRPIELITPELVGLNNQYWVSFYIDQTIFDKKFIFLPDTLLDNKLIDIPGLDQKGILII
mgnify:FL=1